LACPKTAVLTGLFCPCKDQLPYSLPPMRKVAPTAHFCPPVEQKPPNSTFKVSCPNCSSLPSFRKAVPTALVLPTVKMPCLPTYRKAVLTVLRCPGCPSQPIFRNAAPTALVFQTVKRCPNCTFIPMHIEKLPQLFLDAKVYRKELPFSSASIDSCPNWPCLGIC